MAGARIRGVFSVLCPRRQDSNRCECHPNFEASPLSLCYFSCDTRCSPDLESILAAPKFQELAVCVCSSCSLKISDKKFLAISAGEMPIPGASQRSLGYGNSYPAPDSSLQSPAATARIQLSQRDNAVDTPRVDRLDSANDTKSPQVHPKVPNAAGCKAENFAFVCAWKEFPDIQRLFAACAASAVEGFQVFCLSNFSFVLPCRCSRSVFRCNFNR